jgi:hypothetical protein
MKQQDINEGLQAVCLLALLAEGTASRCGVKCHYMCRRRALSICHLKWFNMGCTK